MTEMAWAGVFPEAVLPFEEDFTLDERAFRGLLRWLASQDGVRGVVVNGRLGEVSTLLAEERAEVVRIAVDELPARMLVIAGVYAEGTIEAEIHARAADRAGADGILLLPPQSWLRFGAPARATTAFASSVGAAAELPVLLDWQPASIDELAELADAGHVTGLRVHGGDISNEIRLAALRSQVPGLAIFAGDDYLLPALVQGVDGVIGGLACAQPSLVDQLLRAVVQGDLRNVLAIHSRLAPLAAAMVREGQGWTISGVLKELLVQRGFLDRPLVRPPSIELPRSERDAIRTVRSVLDDASASGRRSGGRPRGVRSVGARAVEAGERTVRA